MKSFKTSGVSSEEGSRLQQNIDEALNAFGSADIVSGVLVKNVEVTAGTVSIGHGLGRIPKGWVITRSTADIRAWQGAKTPTARLLHLQTNAAGTVDIWVF